MPELTRPPIGVKPRFLIEESRLKDLSEAIERRTEARMPIPFDWIQEYNELSERIDKRKCSK